MKKLVICFMSVLSLVSIGCSSDDSGTSTEPQQHYPALLLGTADGKDATNFTIYEKNEDGHYIASPKYSVETAVGKSYKIKISNFGWETVEGLHVYVYHDQQETVLADINGVKYFNLYPQSDLEIVYDNIQF